MKKNDICRVTIEGYTSQGLGVARLPEGVVFVRRDRTAEASALDAIRQDGLVQMRMTIGQGTVKGRMVFAFRGRDAAEAWQVFVTERLPLFGRYEDAMKHERAVQFFKRRG